MSRPFPSSLLICSLIVAGCSSDAPPPLSPADAGSALAARLAPVGSPIIVHDFPTPESALHDPVADVYLVSNVNGHPQGLTNDGFISRIAPDGTVLEREWIRGGQRAG